LKDKYERDLAEAGECPLDEGGYFIINGGEKVIIAQERMANNNVFTFMKKQPSKFSVIAEIRSQIKAGPTSTCRVMMMSRKSSRTGGGQSENSMIAMIPYTRKEIPIIVVFRALGVVADNDILRHIVYDFDDDAMLEKLRPSLEESMVIQTQEVALDYIGTRGQAVGVVKSKRIAHAKEILMKEFLPHMGIEAFQEEKKAYFLGYMVHRLLLVAMGRHPEDDRDHFGVKRMDMAGPLMSTLFRDFFKKLTKEVYLTVKKHADANREINIPAAVNPHTISKGFRFALATGNWSEQNGGNYARAGVALGLQRLKNTTTLMRV
jgi:DNA-directed RNA polymerase II subunit RPB2